MLKTADKHVSTQQKVKKMSGLIVAEAISRSHGLEMAASVDVFAPGIEGMDRRILTDYTLDLFSQVIVDTPDTTDKLLYVPKKNFPTFRFIVVE